MQWIEKLQRYVSIWNPKKKILKDIAKQVQLQFLEANYAAIELLLAKAKEKRRM